MKVMVVGSGGREHALCWKISESPAVDEVLCVPGSDGIGQVARCLTGNPLQLARAEGVDLVVIGPEAELAAGLADDLRDAGIAAFGPSAEAARLEASKSFAKEVMDEAGVPTASWTVHTDLDDAIVAARSRDGRCVIKADGLAAGKGVTVCRDLETAEAAIRCCFEGSFGAAGDRVIVEDLLEGEELSVLALCSGSTLLPMVAAQDHKAVNDDDEGPNTGGMGAYAPAPAGDDALLARVRDEVLQPTADAMVRRGTPVNGVLYVGLMIVDGEPKVLEFNLRFGDPETQPLLALLDCDLLPLLDRCARGELAHGDRLEWKPGVALCVVMASGGYPGSYPKGLPIEGLDSFDDDEDLLIFHAGTRLEDEQWVTAGGRVLGVTARGPDVATAKAKAYVAVSRIGFEGEHHRNDIADKALWRAER